MVLRRPVLVGLLGAFITFIVANPALAHITAFTINQEVDLAPGGLQMAVTGTLQCTAGETGRVNVTISQDRGQQVAVAFAGSDSINCDGTVQEWGVIATTSSPFKKGKAGAVGFASSFGVSGHFDSAQAPAEVHLR